MEHIDFPPDQVLGVDSFDNSAPQDFYYTSNATWQLSMDAENMSRNAGLAQAESSSSRQQNASMTVPLPHGLPTTATLDIRTSMAAAANLMSTGPLQTANFPFSQGLDVSTALLTTSDLQFPLQSYGQEAGAMDSLFTGTYGMPLNTSPIDEYIPTTQEPLQNNGLDTSYLVSSFSGPPSEAIAGMAFHYNDFGPYLQNSFNNMSESLSSNEYINPSMANSSPQEMYLSRSLSNQSDNSWALLDGSNKVEHSPRHSMDGFSDLSVSLSMVSPQILHHRTDSQSSDIPPHSARSVSSFEEIMFPVSPEPESQSEQSQLPTLTQALPILPSPENEQYSPAHSAASRDASSAVIIRTPQAIAASPSSSSSTSPSASSAGSPKARRRNSPISPIGVTTPKTIVKKKAPASASSGKEKAEKKVGRRRGPLRPEQRQQAHEIRKLRACLRCKFLKKVCDKGDPCGGCQPAHARLWQVPCTRMDIKDIASFLKGWNADYERHVNCSVSIANIKGFSQYEHRFYITHGYGYFMPIKAHEVYVVDEKCFGVDWMEQLGPSNSQTKTFEVNTAKLAANLDTISAPMISNYLDMHIDQGFEKFVDEYFDGTKFVTELLKTTYRYYVRTQLPVIRKGLKLVVAYALTLHITLIEGLPEQQRRESLIVDPQSRYYGKSCAPVMINFQIKKAMADMWRELMKDILEELSALYSSVYSGDKLKNWPTIFMTAALILCVWELMQFDCHYRVPDEGAVKNFCHDMESVPVGVIVGLFSAISTKLPSFLEWDTRKHSHVLNNNLAVCDAMTEIRGHVEKYETYLRGRNDAKYDREDFDCLSNKFLSKLVIRANS